MLKYVGNMILILALIVYLTGCGGGGSKNQAPAATQTTSNNNNNNNSPTYTPAPTQTSQPTQNTSPTIISSNENTSPVVISTVSVSKSTCGDTNIASSQYDEMTMALTDNPDFGCTGGWKETYLPENCDGMNKIYGTQSCYHAGVDISKWDAEGRSAFSGVYGRVSYTDKPLLSTTPTYNSYGRVTVKISDNLYCTTLHLKEIYVPENYFVCPKTEIGHIGKTHTNAPHLHFECSSFNSAVNNALITLNPYLTMKQGQSVTFDYDYSYIDQTAAPIARKGEVPVVVINLKNDSTKTLSKNGPNPFRLGTSCYEEYCNSLNGQDRPSEFADSTWKGDKNRIEMVQDSVPPCGIATFNVHLNTSGNNVPIGKRRIYFTPVLEGLKWLKNIGIYTEIEVKTN